MRKFRVTIHCDQYRCNETTLLAFDNSPTNKQITDTLRGKGWAVSQIPKMGYAWRDRCPKCKGEKMPDRHYWSRTWK